MGMTVGDYLSQLAALLPRGWAWRPGAVQVRLLTAFSDEFARVDARLLVLIDESDPRTTLELLGDWERVAGLPDPCVHVVQSIAQRRAALTAKLISTGGQSRRYFIELAAAFGYPGATIDEFSIMTCNDDCNDDLDDVDAPFIWRLNLPGDANNFWMTCNDDCNSFLQTFGDEAIECRVRHLAPAHTTVLFSYSED